MTSAEEKEFSLAATIKQIEKLFGVGTIMHLNSAVERAKVQVIPTGSLSLDLALGVGGLPRGRIVEIYGLESSGKTTLALHCLAEAQKLGGKVAFIDSEHALDPAYAERIGINIQDLLISQPDSGEQALDIAERLIGSGAIDIVVIDSVAALVPRAELEGTIDENQPGLQARLMSKAMRRLTAIVHRTNAILIFINQIRHKIGVLYGNPETTSGGNALKFYSSVRIELRPLAKIKTGDQYTGVEVSTKVVKNKVAPPFRMTVLKLVYGEGISRLDDVITAGLKAKIIDRAGAWLSYQGTRLGQGMENSKIFLKEEPELATEIAKAVLAAGQIAPANVK